MWFKGLVAVTCLAVLAAIGWWFWQDQQDRRLAEELAVAAQHAASARECRAMLSDMEQGRTEGLILGHVLFCVKGDYFTLADMRDRGLHSVAKQTEDHIAEFGSD